MAVDSSPTYAKGALLGSDKDYHGELSTVHAQHALSINLVNHPCYVPLSDVVRTKLNVTLKKLYQESFGY